MPTDPIAEAAADAPARSRPPRLFLNPGADKRVGGGHPWVYSNEVRMDDAARALAAGTVVSLHRVDGKPLGVGFFNPQTLISVRLLDRLPDTAVDRRFFAKRLRRALALRQRLYDQPFYRLVHAEADGLPGLIIDRYDQVLVAQLNAAGIETLRAELLAAIADVLGPEAVVLRNDSAARAAEGLSSEVSVASGGIDRPVIVREGGLSFFADLLSGQKTGWYFDQRENRAFVAPLARGGRLLDCFCYTGGFAVAAVAAGADQALGIDSSEPALALARQAAAANGVEDRCRFVRGDAFAELERLARDGARFQVVVADPPAFARSKREVGSALKGYRKLVRLAAGLVAAGGYLFVASCSHNVEAGAFAAEVSRGIVQAGRDGRFLRQAGAGADHPVHLFLPETAYLKSVLAVLD